MRHALALGRRGIGRTGPNPSVGCVLVSKDGRVVGRGRTSDGGRPHAEANALARAGDAARGATAYVTLEPCAPITETPSCAQLLAAAGVARVVLAVQDPDLRTNGAGVAKLRDAQIEVATGLLAKEAAASHEGFFKRISASRPFVTLKVAQSRDGKTVPGFGKNKWITGEEARRFGHLLRARNDAILVGINTVLSDDPELTCRLPGLEEHSPLRVVLDSELRLGEHAKVTKTALLVPTIVFTTVLSGGEKLRSLGVEVVQVARDAQGRTSLSAVVTELAKRKITRLLVEGGATVHAAFLDASLADRLEIFTAPSALGAKGRGEITSLAALTSGKASRFQCISRRKLGIDRLESFVAKA
jgi:diaminohydroxyphosphoribosylaminopyrimidine deaminase/5-amino-6-(5-phosphoribosylamino)uracil reductase